jgi:hypothetical protein
VAQALADRQARYWKCQPDVRPSGGSLWANNSQVTDRSRTRDGGYSWVSSVKLRTVGSGSPILQIHKTPFDLLADIARLSAFHIRP